MNLNPFNGTIMKHPLNWLIVVAVAVLGAMFIYHAMMVPAAVKKKMGKNKGSPAPNAQGSADAAGADDMGSFNT
jgi:hypothetical protein